MTAQEYREAGFAEVSLQMSDAAIARAETDVTQAYLEPLVGEVDLSVTLVKDCLMNLSVLLLMQRSIHLTRAGAKEKTTTQSYTAQRWDILSQASTTCTMKLERVATEYHVDEYWTKVRDICGLNFETHYFNL